MHPLAKLFLNAFIMGLVITAVSEIARRFPRLGALILTMPLVIPAVFVVMYLRDRELGPVVKLSRQTLMLIPLGLPFFVPLALAERMRMSFWAAFGVGVVLVMGTIGAYLWWTAPEA
jgi:hypothetical protein